MLIFGRERHRSDQSDSHDSFALTDLVCCPSLGIHITPSTKHLINYGGAGDSEARDYKSPRRRGLDGPHRRIGKQGVWTSAP